MDEPIMTRLTLTFFTGFDEEGNETVQSRHFYNVKSSASNEGLLATAQAISSLQQHELSKIERINTYELYN